MLFVAPFASLSLTAFAQGMDQRDSTLSAKEMVEKMKAAAEKGQILYSDAIAGGKKEAVISQWGKPDSEEGYDAYEILDYDREGYHFQFQLINKTIGGMEIGGFKQKITKQDIREVFGEPMPDEDGYITRDRYSIQMNGKQYYLTMYFEKDPNDLIYYLSKYDYMIILSPSAVNQPAA